MADSERLAKLEMRQELLIVTIDRMVDVFETYSAHLLEVKEVLAEVRDDVTAIRAWADEPPKGDLADTLRALATSVKGLHDAIVVFGREMPVRVADELCR